MADFSDLDALLDAPPPQTGGDLSDLDALLDAPPPKVRAPRRDSLTARAEPVDMPDLTRPAGVMGRSIPAAPPPAAPAIEAPVEALEPIPPETSKPFIGYRRPEVRVPGEQAGPPKPAVDTIQALPEPGILRGVVDAFRRGYRTGNKTADLAIGNALGYDANTVGERLRENTRLEEQLPRPASVEAGLEEISKAQGPWEATKAIVRNPRSVLHVTAESAGGQVPQMLMQAAGATFGPAGLVGATFAGSAGTEFASSLLDEIQEQWTQRYGRPPASGSDWASALRDPAIMDAAKTKAAIRAPIVGGFDAVTAGLAGRWLRMLESSRATPGQWVRAGAKELGMQAGGGAAGELAAQLPTEDNIKWGDVGLEAFAELPTAPGEIHSNVRDYQQTRPDVQLAQALGGEPVIDPLAMRALREQQTLQQIIGKAVNDASQQAPISQGADGQIAGAAPGEPAPVVPPAGDQLGGYAGLAGALGGIDPAGGDRAGTSLYGQQHVPAPYDDPEGSLRGAVPASFASVVTGPGGAEPARPVDELEGYGPDFSRPPVGELETRSADEELGLQPLSEEEVARLGELDGLLEGEPPPVDERGNLVTPVRLSQDRLEAGLRQDADVAAGVLRSRGAREREAEEFLARNPLHEQMLGKIHPEEAGDYGLDLAPRPQTYTQGGRRGQATAGTGKQVTRMVPSPHQAYVARERGLRADAVAEMLQEMGYLQPGVEPDPADVHDMIQRMLAGERIYPQFDEGFMSLERQHQGVLELREYRAELDEAAEQAMVDNIYSGDPDLFDAVYDEIHATDPDPEGIYRAYEAYVRERRGGGQEPPGPGAPPGPIQTGGPDGAAGAREAGPDARGSGGREGDQEVGRAPAQETPPASEGQAAPAAQAEEPAGAAAPAPAVGQGTDTGVEPEGLQSYTPEELRAHDERVRRLERERIEREREAEAKAKADEEVDGFTLTGSDRPADSDPNQGAMFDAVNVERPEATKAQLSRMPPGAGFGKGFEAQAITQRPSRHTDAWTAMGLTPAQGANLPIEQAIKKLQALYLRDFGLKVTVADNAKLVETRDSLLDGYRGISDMMYRLALPLNAVSLNGTLTLHLLPFSKKNAYYGAYFPNTRTINMPGRSNSFGHEWMHALDHFITSLAQRDGNEGLYSMIVGGEGITNPDSQLQASFAELMNRMFFDHADQAWKVLQLQVQAAATNRNGQPTQAARDAQAKLDKMVGGQLKANKNVQPTAYAMSALGFQPGSNYWINPAEMLARAYEAYLANQRPPDMLNEFVSKSEDAYLSDADKRLRETFPKQEDRNRIFNAFDDFFSALRSSNELGTGPTAQRPEGEGVFDPSKWGKYPDNSTRWQRTVQSQLDAFRQWRVPTMSGTAAWAKTRPGKVNEWWHATFLAQRSNMDLIAKKYNNAAPLLQINDMLYVNRGSGRTQGQTLDEAIVTRAHSRNNELAQIMRLSGLANLSDDENRLLRYMLVSAQAMTDNEDVRFKLNEIDMSKISNERIDKLDKLATELRRFLDKEWYYNTRNGIELGYTRNGYMPRVFNYAKVFDNLDAFEEAAAKVYGAQFDRQVGTEVDELNMDEFARSLREVRHSASSALIDMAKKLRSLNAKIRYQERALETSDDPDIVQAKLAELYDERAELLSEMLPVLRDDWSKQAALQWRTHMATGELTEYDTHGPSVSYMRGRTLPPEADVLMADFYNQDVMDAIATYTERSSRRVEYAKRFGVKDEKLKALLEDAAMNHNVHREDLDFIKEIVNNATGRERHGVPKRVQDGLNSISSWMTLYMLGRATFASVSESMAAGVRTRNFGDYFRGFGSIVGDIFNSDDAQARQALAEALGLVAEPYHDALMGNRLAGDSLTREASLRAARYFEYTGLGALTRAQVRSTLPIATAYMRTLGRKAVQGHRPSREELMGLGIPADKQEAFTEWLTEKVATPVPSPADLMDRYNDEFHEFGQLFAVAAKRFSSQVIMEPTKMDKPKLATHPAARFLWGIQSFNMALWYNVTKPLILQVLRDADTLVRGQGKGNAGRNRFEAATNLATAGIAVVMIFQGQLVSTLIRARLLDWDKWQEKERKGELSSWLMELAAWRMGAAGLFDPLVQALRGVKWQRDITSLAAGAQYGALLQNIQDMLTPFAGRNSPNTNTAERKAAKAAWNTAAGPLIAWATSASPLGPLVGPLMGLVNVYAGSGMVQEKAADVLVGPADSPGAKKAAKAASGEVDPQAELREERKRRRAEEKAAR